MYILRNTPQVNFLAADFLETTSTGFLDPRRIFKKTLSKKALFQTLRILHSQLKKVRILNYWLLGFDTYPHHPLKGIEFWRPLPNILPLQLMGCLATSDHLEHLIPQLNLWILSDKLAE